MSKTAMLTTVDNPFDPFKDFRNWFAWDSAYRHHCCELVAENAHTAEGLTDAENDAEVNRAINQIVASDPFNIYMKVTKD